MASIIQAVAAVVQAVAGVGDATANLGGLATPAINAKPTLEYSRSRMVAKMTQLDTVRREVENQFKKYWFSKKRVDLWLNAVDIIDLQVKELNDKCTKGDRAWVFPYIALTRAIDVMCADIDEALNEGRELGDAMAIPETRRIVQLPTPINIANISALSQKLEQLLEYIKDPGYGTIRLHGLVGTGKRVLIQHLNNHEIVKNKFQIVIWLPASDYENRDKDCSIEVCVQLIIAKRLGLDIGGIKDVNVLAEQIRAELDGAKYLLLLDDLKSKIQLETIGIPRNTNGSKVVFTTYLRDVFPFGSLTPSTQFFNIEIGKLDDGDSWQLFEGILINENDTIQQYEIGNIALKVVKWCDGYFSLINKVAENFKSKRSPQSWSDGLKMLRNPAKKGDTYKKPFESFLNFSYASLDDNQKLCFLFTVLYPEGSKIPIDCLFDCWTTHELIVHGVPEGSSVTAQDILEHLLAKALLNECSNKQYVTIDKVFRAAAMDILQECNKFKCLVAEEALKKLKKDSCKDAHWISLSESKIDVLPEEVDCPKLTTLFLQKNSNPATIPSSFFKKMNDLLILDLYKTGSELVLPLSDLQRLKVLYANGCAKFLFKIEGLDHMLEVLDIRGCIISKLPHDIGKLKHLRRLMVSIHGGGTLDPIICKLSSLKELIIDVKLDAHINKVSYMSWCNKVIGNIIEKIDTLMELTTLKVCFEDDIVDVIQVRGDTLKFSVPKQASLQHILKDRNIHYCALQVYIGVRMTMNLEIPKYFHKYDSFVLSCEKIVKEPIMEKVLSKVESVIMRKDNSVESLDQIFMPHIHHCFVQRCNKIETLIQTDGFSNLETLVLSECSQLKALFLNNVVQKAMGIKHLEIRNCPALEKINMLSISGGDILPTLTTLILHDLQMLEMLCSDMVWSSLSTLEIHKCPKLTILPLNKNSATNLRNIKVEKVWWKNLELDIGIKHKFTGYCKFSD